MARAAGGVDMMFIKKAEVQGNTLVEIAREREAQMRNAPRQPSILQEIVTAHMLARDDEAIEKRLRAAALVRAKPNSRQKPPSTEIEILVAGAPKTSAQVVGYHEVPKFTPLPVPPKKLDELGRMRTYYPQTQGGTYGFHHDFTNQSATMAKEATELVGALSIKQVKKDPEMAAALAAIKRRTLDLGRNHGSDGVARGVQRKRG